MPRPAVERVDAAVWEGWMGLVVDGSRLLSQAPLERMLRITTIEASTPPSQPVSRERAALLAADVPTQRQLVLAALAYRGLYEAILEQAGHHP